MLSDDKSHFIAPYNEYLSKVDPENIATHYIAVSGDKKPDFITLSCRHYHFSESIP